MKPIFWIRGGQIIYYSYISFHNEQLYTLRTLYHIFYCTQYNYIYTFSILNKRANGSFFEYNAKLWIFLIKNNIPIFANKNNDYINL